MRILFYHSHPLIRANLLQEKPARISPGVSQHASTTTLEIVSQLLGVSLHLFGDIALNCIYDHQLALMFFSVFMGMMGNHTDTYGQFTWQHMPGWYSITWVPPPLACVGANAGSNWQVLADWLGRPRSPPCPGQQELLRLSRWIHGVARDFKICAIFSMPTGLIYASAPLSASLDA